MPLLKILSDTAVATDSGFTTAVCLLDLSALFDTVDHEILRQTYKNVQMHRIDYEMVCYLSCQ